MPLLRTPAISKHVLPTLVFFIEISLIIFVLWKSSFSSSLFLFLHYPFPVWVAMQRPDIPSLLITKIVFHYVYVFQLCNMISNLKITIKMIYIFIRIYMYLWICFYSDSVLPLLYINPYFDTSIFTLHSVSTLTILTKLMYRLYA